MGAEQEVVSRAALCGAGSLDTWVPSDRPSHLSYWEVER